MKWHNAAKRLEGYANRKNVWRYGQEHSLRWVARKLFAKDERNGVLIADEVGMGKTRVALAAVLATLENNGTAAVLVPPGLIEQWKAEWESLLQILPEKDRQKFSPIILQTSNSILNPGKWGIKPGKIAYPLSTATRKPPHWFLISHNLSKPTAAEQLLLLVRAMQQHRTRKRAFRNALSYTWKRIDTCLARDCRDCGMSDCRHSAYKAAAAFLRKCKYKNFYTVREQKEASRKLENCWPELLRLLIGRIDLLVIDEAHKCPGEESRLSNQMSLIFSKVCKRIALTATPVSIDEENNWATIFERLDEGKKYTKEIKNAIHEFCEARKTTELTPANEAVRQQLYNVSVKFQEAVSPYVARRRKITEKDMRRLLQKAGLGQSRKAHPHRDFQIRPIKYEKTNTDWQRNIFAMESIGKAAKGCNTSDTDKKLDAAIASYRLFDSRYSAGHIPSVIYGDEIDNLQQQISSFCRHQNKHEKSLCAKLRRFSYWHKKIRCSNNELMLHPRIQGAADCIEEILKRDTTGECKVLVFGTFNKPLRALVDVLNCRKILDLIKKRAMLPPVSRKYQDKLQYAYPTKKQVTPDRINSGIRRYEQERKRLSAKFKAKNVEEWFETNFSQSIAQADSGKIAELIRHRMMLDNLTGKIENPVSLLDSYRQNIRDLSMIKFVEFLKEEFVAIGKEMRFARILDGKVSPESRKAMQARFNDKNSFLRVLVAQSQIGKEGLNLHKCCRHIVQFNPEWNPGTTEQQIGRVDRIGSYWEQRASSKVKIEVIQIVFEGTYDEFQANVAKGRQNGLYAQLFGELIPHSEIDRLNLGKSALNKLKAAIPNFSPAHRLGGH